jgi:hypothetical protein
MLLNVFNLHQANVSHSKATLDNMDVPAWNNVPLNSDQREQNVFDVNTRFHFSKRFLSHI